MDSDPATGGDVRYTRAVLWRDGHRAAA